ncbi:hypothetical protein HDC36_004203 [Xanthomonas sp. JAI131]|uniref:hypothetical protein n=1 Tax=Xanthomonas sp. JAI131 TaxID=2723067 RepID=UPI0015CD971D|nr:hypothetical protein [Xanthomonas sp. JAI131]NYF22726.1 hypothetical protein [Xanthomonas sp. JAI131]
MDFLKILKSFEDFVYEALTWLILLPQTLLRIMFSPRRMATYAERELASADDEQRFGDSISPPLLLILCILIAHLVDLEIRAQTPTDSGSLADALLASEQNLLLYRTIAFGVWSLAGAACYLVGERIPINRQTLRGPFYEQCYLVAPFALVVSIGGSLLLIGTDAELPGACMILAAVLWFWCVQIVWFRHRMRIALWRSAVASTITLLIGAGINLGVGHALSHVQSGKEAPAAEADSKTKSG